MFISFEISLVVFSHMIDRQIKWNSSTHSPQQVFKDTILHYWRCTDVHVMLCKFKSQLRQPSWRILLMHFSFFGSLVSEDFLNLAWQPRSVCHLTSRLLKNLKVTLLFKESATLLRIGDSQLNECDLTTSLTKCTRNLGNQYATYSIHTKLLIQINY